MRSAMRSLRLGAALVWLLAPACSGPPIDPRSAPLPGETRTFEGTWSASGSRRTLELERGHKASIFTLTGSVLLTGERGLGVGFQGDVIGFSDSVAGGTGQCVWTDERGDKVFSQLRGQPIGTGSHVVGTITGGTGRWALFVSQSSQVLALFGVFVEVGLRTGVPAPLMAFALLFASSYFSTITPQGGSQNVIFVGSGYLTQGELYRLGALTTAFCLLVFLLLRTPWLLMIVR